MAKKQGIVEREVCSGEVPDGYAVITGMGIVPEGKHLDYGCYH